MYLLRDRTALDLLGEAGASLGPDALRNMSDCVMMLDRAGRITQVSRGSLSALEMAGEAEAIGRKWWEIWPAEAHTPLQEAVQRGLQGHITQYWTTYVHTDGSVSQWDIRLSPVQDAASEVTSVIAVSRKLTTH